MEESINAPVPPSALPSFPGRCRRAAAWIKRRHNVLIFVGGFLFDAATLKRIDSWLDLGFQLAYLAGLTFLLVGQHREATGHWRPRGFLDRAWKWNVEVLHFFYGGLLSNYVVFYAKSASGFRPLVFFGLLVLLLVANEMPAVRRLGHRLRLGLYAFCVASFLIYFVPVLVGRMGDAVFALSLLLAAGTVWGVSAWLVRPAPPPERRRRQWVLAWPATAVLSALALLYFFRLVPPVPLSVKFHGIYHSVVKQDGTYLLRAAKPPLWLFWRRDSRPFLAAPGDDAYYFVRVFAPRGFHHRISVRWEEWDPAAKAFVTRAVVPIGITGGRDQGFRTFSYFSNITPGLWRAGVVTEDGRSVGRLSFSVAPSDPAHPLRWIISRA